MVNMKMWLLMGLMLAICVSPVFPQTLSSPLFECSMQPAQAKLNLDYRGQYTPETRKQIVDLQVTVQIQKSLRIGYFFQPGQRFEDTVQAPFVVGDVQFEKDKTSPIGLEISTLPYHRITIEPIFSYPLRPLFVMESTGMIFHASALVDDKPIEATEAFRRTFYGIGGAMTWNYRDLGVDFQLAGAKDYLFLEALFQTPVTKQINLGVGYRHQKLSWDDLKVRSDSWLCMFKLSF